MIAEGLLWFDDDPRRPLQEKIANAIERYSERTGWLPTVCETHPAQAESVLALLARNASATAASTTARRGAASATPAKPPVAASSRRQAKAAAPVVELPPKLRVTPNAALRPNYFLVGVEPGDRLRKAPSQSSSATQRKARRAPATTSEPAAPAPSSQPPKTPKAPRAPRAKAS